MELFHSAILPCVMVCTQDCWAVNDTASVQVSQQYQTQLLLFRRVRHLINEAMMTIVHSHYLVCVGTN